MPTDGVTEAKTRPGLMSDRGRFLAVIFGMAETE